MKLRTFPASNNQQGNSADQGQTAKNRRDRNMLLLVGGGVDGPEIEDSFPMGIIESLIGEGQAAQNNQQNSNPDDRFHSDGPRLSSATPSLKEIDHENDQGHEQENVDETSEGVRRNHAEEPKYAEDDENCPQHRNSNLTRNRRFERLCRAGESHSFFPGGLILDGLQLRVCPLEHTLAFC